MTVGEQGFARHQGPGASAEKTAGTKTGVGGARTAPGTPMPRAAAEEGGREVASYWKQPSQQEGIGVLLGRPRCGAAGKTVTCRETEGGRDKGLLRQCVPFADGVTCCS